MAGIFATLGTETSLFIRGEKVLRAFDDAISDTVTEQLEANGVDLRRKRFIYFFFYYFFLSFFFLTLPPFSNVASAKKNEDGKITLQTKEGLTLDGYDVLLYAIGRVPNTEINLDKAGVKVFNIKYHTLSI